MTDPDPDQAPGGPDWSLPLEGRPDVAHVVVTTRAHGDLAVGVERVELSARRRRVVDAPWSWLRQVHGADVVVVTRPGEHAGAAADALCTTVTGAPIVVQVADCAPLALVDPAGVVAVVHAGWRGLVAGVVGRTLDVMGSLGATRPIAVLGPCIRPAAYEFGAADLDTVVDLFGPAVRSGTSWGTPALDLPAAVAAALAAAGSDPPVDLGGCTAADGDRRWSHRARGDTARQAMVVWIEPT